MARKASFTLSEDIRKSLHVVEQTATRKADGETVTFSTLEARTAADADRVFASLPASVRIGMVNAKIQGPDKVKAVNGKNPVLARLEEITASLATAKGADFKRLQDEANKLIASLSAAA